MTVDALPPPALTPLACTGYCQRIAVLRQRMSAAGIAVLALASPEDIYYLTGLDHLGYFAFTLLVVPGSGQPLLVTREMERPTVHEQVPWCRHLTFSDAEPPVPAAVAALAAASAPGGTVAMDEESMFFPPAVATAIRRCLPGRRWQPGSGLLAAQRAIKSPAEIGYMRQAASICDCALAAGLAIARPGVSERVIAARICRAMIEAGGQLPGFPPLIRPLGLLSQEHISWSDRLLRRGMGLFIELSASVRRYHAPQSRTVYIGEVPEGARGAAEVALAGLAAARDALRPGVLTGDVYAAWQRAVAGSAVPAWPLRHHCGYLVGIGFPPSWVGGEVLGIRAGGTTEIACGMTFHLMSWVTQPAGHVISGTALVTPTGAELLTATPRELTVIA